VAGGLIGGLTGVGVPEDEAQVYAEAVRRGGALVTVRADDARAEQAASIMRNFGAVDIERRAELWRGRAGSAMTQTRSHSVPNNSSVSAPPMLAR